MTSLSGAEAAFSAIYGLGTGGGIIIGMRFIQWLETFRAARLDKQQAHVDEGMAALIKGLREEVDRMKVEAAEDRAEIAEVRRELQSCERKHAESEAKVARLEAILQGYGDARQHAALIVAAEKQEPKQ